MSIDDERERRAKVIQLVRDAIQYDVQLREKYTVGDKFRFIRDRLNGLLQQLEAHAQTDQEVSVSGEESADNETLVYVYLYNAQGALLRSWQPMLIPKVFYEYSINRPIYSEKNQIESIIRSKPNRQQHAYLTVSLKRDNILSTGGRQDTLGSPLIKIKEGSLQFKNLVTFTHNNEDYVVDARGEFVKKS